MGYRFWELYMSWEMPNVRWRGSPAQEYYKESPDYAWSGRRLRMKFALKWVALPFGLTASCAIAFYYVLKGQAMLHILHRDSLLEGAVEYYNHTLGRHIQTAFDDEHALRQREAYRKALELEENKIFEEYKKYEEPSN